MLVLKKINNYYHQWQHCERCVECVGMWSYICTHTPILWRIPLPCPRPQRLAKWTEPPFKFVDLTYLLIHKMWISMSCIEFHSRHVVFFFFFFSSKMYVLLKDLLQLHITMKRSTTSRWLHTTKTRFLVLGAQTPAVLCKQGTKGSASLCYYEVLQKVELLHSLWPTKWPW